MIFEKQTEDGRIRTCSDAGMHILREDGVRYEDAVDSEPHTYTETDIPLPDPELTAEETLEILLGGNADA